MKLLVLLIAFLGISSLLFLNYTQEPIVINNQDELSNLVENQKVSISGQIVKESKYQNLAVLTFANNLTVHCYSSCPWILHKNVTVIAKIEDYREEVQLSLLSIKYHD